jgi:phenolic acid decarboxylase
MEDYFSETVENAVRLANYWHQGQKRMDSEFDYFTHLAAVATLVVRAGFSEDVIAAAYCHDLLNTTGCPPEEIVSVCGQKVFQIVELLKEEESNSGSEEWKRSRQNFIDRIRTASPEVKAVCIADRIHNVHILMEELKEHGMIYFDKFVVGPEEKLWFEDNMCMMLQETWSHPLLSEYDYLIDEFVNFLEDLDEGEDLSGVSVKQVAAARVDFDKPNIDVTNYGNHLSIEEQKIIQKSSKSPAPLPSLSETKARKKRKSLVVDSATKGLYLTDEQYDLLLPAVLQLAISKGEITNGLMQERLKINYLTGFKILKELKRLHIISKADNFKPRKINVSRANEVLKELINL